MHSAVKDFEILTSWTGNPSTATSLRVPSAFSQDVNFAEASMVVTFPVCPRTRPEHATRLFVTCWFAGKGAYKIGPDRPRLEGVGLSVVHVVSCFVLGSQSQFHKKTRSWKRAPYILIFQPSTVCTLIVSWTCAAASLHWRKHMYQRMCPCCLYWAAPVCVFAIAQKRARFQTPNDVAIQKLEAQFPDSCPLSGPMVWAPALP